MKTMTCKQMGGPCDEAFTADSADKMVDAGSTHVTTKAAEGDVEHMKVADMMAESQADPAKAKVWFDSFMETYNSLPDNA